MCRVGIGVSEGLSTVQRESLLRPVGQKVVPLKVTPQGDRLVNS